MARRRAGQDQPGRFDVGASLTWDAAGNLVNQARAGGGLSVSASWIYDDRGRLISETDERGKTTAHAYSDPAHTLTTTFPDGTARVESYFLDRALKSIGGSAAYPELYDYDVDGNTFCAERRRPVIDG